MAQSQLYLLVRQCIHQRKSPQDFKTLLELAVRKWRLTNIEIVVAIVKTAFGYCADDDPLLPSYLQLILAAQLAQPSDFLAACVRHWQTSTKQGSGTDVQYAKSLAQFIADLMIITSNVPLSTAEARNCMLLSSRWLQTLFKLTTSDEVKCDFQHVSVLVNALGGSLIIVLNSTAGNNALSAVEDNKNDQLNVDIRKTIQESMAGFPDVSVQLMTQAQKHAALDDTALGEANNAQAAEMAALTFENNIADPQVVPSRTATYVLLHSALLQASTIDDTSIFNFLTARYSGNTALMFSDLLFSSLNALVKPSQSNQPMYRAQCQIYLHNKLPAILAVTASSLEPIPTEQYLLEAWKTFSPLGDEDTQTTIRRFLNVCALHHLISNDALQNMTVEVTDTNTAKLLFPKQALLEQVKANASRGPRLVDELVKNDGNVGSFSAAIVETLHRYCQAKETQHLKELCNALVRQPSALNALGMFTIPSYILSPLCNLLDDWSWEDIHGESQPVYEEFGSVLLLIMATKFRLRLRNDQLGITNHSGFVAQYLTSGQSEKTLNQMTDSERSNLGDWIHSLYESEGISDDVTSNCSAKEFYSTVPTLLRQSMTAFARGKLPQDRLEGGLDYLLEPFLLPSLLSAFAWLSRALPKDQKHAGVILRRLTRSPVSPETNKLHRTILNIAKDWFSHLFAGTLEPNNDLSAAFDAFSPFTVELGLSTDELKTWTNEAGGILIHMETAISELQNNTGSTLYQPNMIIAATQIRGACAVVESMVKLLVHASSMGDFPHHLLDIVATIIAATDVTGVSLRNAMQLLHARLSTFINKGQTIVAEACVHLSRRVDLYATALTPQPASADQTMNSLQGVDLTDINLDQMPELDAEPVKQQLQPDLSQQTDPQLLASEDLNQMFNDAANAGGMDDYNMNEDTMFEGMDYNLDDLGNIDDYNW